MTSGTSNPLFDDTQSKILEETIGIKDKDILSKMKLSDLKEFNLSDSIKQNDFDWDFVFPQPVEIERLGKGLYSPFQILFYHKFLKTQESVQYEAPFMFNTIAHMIGIFHEKEPSGTGETDEHNKKLRETYRQLLQSVFWIREKTEEREPPSLEIHLPFDDVDDTVPSIPINLLANVFGRGVAICSGKELVNGLAGRGYVKIFYSKHNGAPLSQLYNLDDDPYKNLGEFLSIILRRDGHITIAQKSNPFLEFYDGGWHIVDFSSWGDILGFISSQKFGKQIDSEVITRLARLAYHMATHWHGGILAIVDPEKVNEFLASKQIEHQDASDDGSLICNSLVNGHFEGAGEPVGEKVLMAKGIGRALMCAAIQDGATLFDFEGKLLMTSAMVKFTGDVEEGGARHRAAKKLGEIGIALAISVDGGIRVYSSDNEKWNIDGIRIH